MEQLDRQLILKYRRGELLGNAAIIFCGAATVAFAVLFALGQIFNSSALLLTALIAAPICIAAGAGVAAYCYSAFTKKLDKLCSDHIKITLSENAEKLRPERPALSYAIAAQQDRLTVSVNGAKQNIFIDFSAFEKLSAWRKASLCDLTAAALTSAFCRMYERGAKYSSVSYTVGNKNKTVYIIKDGEPDKAAYKKYLRGRAN